MLFFTHFLNDAPRNFDKTSYKLIMNKGGAMLYWAAIFFIIALIAAILGFGGVAAASASIAQVLFFIFLVGFIISVILHFAKEVDDKTKF